jgi:hypothetical protein
MDDDWAALLALWPDGPEDTGDCIFIQRALKQIEAQIDKPERALQLVLDAIEQKVLALRYRLFNAAGGDLGAIKGGAYTREIWRECLARGYIMVRDDRPWLPTAQRRAIPQPHWLFVTRESLKKFLEGLPSPSSTARAERSAVIHLANLLKQNPTLSRDAAKAECRTFKISGAGFRYRVWPGAREMAGLPARGKSGPKNSSSYSSR